MSYRVSTQVYSGPFDLLLQLVTRQKVDIGAISISEVAEQYLAEAERIEALDLDVASDFLLVAATLLDIKAASLVPQETPCKADDDDDEFDEDLEELSALDGDALREVLIQRLIAYKQFKGAAAALGARMQAESRMHPRVAGPDPEFLGLMPDYLAGITLRGLAVICADLDGKRQTRSSEPFRSTASRAPRPMCPARAPSSPNRSRNHVNPFHAGGKQPQRRPRGAVAGVERPRQRTRAGRCAGYRPRRVRVAARRAQG